LCVTPQKAEFAMTEYCCLAIQGLDEFAVGEPIEVLAEFLNARTPEGIHFEVKGGVDPQLDQADIIEMMVAARKAGKVLIAVSHSKGAMLLFYAADALKAQGLTIQLAVSIDSTGWGSNAPGTTQWAIILGQNAGVWLIPDNADHWMHFRQPYEPGGGRAALAHGNDHTQFENFSRTESHIALPATPAVETQILQAILELVK
jgi:hypothetical protein